MLIPYFKQVLKENPPTKQLCDVVLDKEQNKTFRMFVIDNISNVISNGYLSDDVTKTLIKIAQDQTDNEAVRRYALLSLRKQGAYGSGTESTLQKIFDNEANPPIVRGAALTAMRRTGDPSLKDAVENVLISPQIYHDAILQYAVVEASKSGHSKNAVGNLKNIALTTESAEVYGSTIYSLGITDTPEAIEAILTAYGRFDNEYVCRGSLKLAYKAIMKMIDLGQPAETIRSGIMAAKLASVKPTIDLLKLIEAKSENLELREQASKAINDIQNSDAPDIFSKLEGK